MKARSFLGVFGLHVGTMVAAVSHVFIGFILWTMIDYLRPQLRIFGILLLIIFSLVSSIGIYAAYKRHVILMWSYLAVSSALTLFLIFLSLDCLDLINFLPTPPDRPTTSGDVVHFAPTLELATMFSRPRKLKARTSPLWLTGGVSSWGWLGNGDHVPIGASEEVSVDELPPEVRDLPKDLQMTITATTKTIKHVIKLVFGGCLVLLSLWMGYAGWIAGSFAMDKCQSFEKAEAMPDQFPEIEGLPSDEVDVDDVVHPSRLARHPS